MAVCGIDLGNASATVAAAGRGGVDVILSDSSKRSTPVLVSFVGRERFLGEGATTQVRTLPLRADASARGHVFVAPPAQVRTNMNNTIAHLKRVVGRKLSEPGIAAELDKFINARLVPLPNDDVGVEVNYNGEQKVFSATQVLAMFFTKLRENILREKPGVVTPDVVVSVPAFFTDGQRRAVADAATIAGLKCLRVLNDGTAAALSYGIYKSAKKEFAEGGETRVLFLDMGHAHFTATIAGFTNTSLRILASASAPDVGGRDIDAAIAQHLAGVFKAATGIDAWRNKKARVKLLIAAEKAKIAITPFGVNATPVSIECLLEDRDLSTTFTIETLEELVAPLMLRVQETVRAALAQAGVASAAELAAVELVGGSMRPRPCKRAAALALGLTLNEDTNHGLSTSLNLDECIARGCALACAMLSPVFKVKPFDIIDRIPIGVRVAWDAPPAAAAAEQEAMDVDEEGGGAGASAESTTSMTLFRAGEAAPLTRRITFRRAATFDVTAEYEPTPETAALLPAGHPRTLGRYTVSGIPADAVEAGAPAPRVRIDFRYDLNGCFSVVKAELLKEIKEAAAAAAATPTAQTPAAADAAPAAADGTPTADGAPAAPPPAAADAEKPKKRYKRVELAVAEAPNVSIGLTAAEVAAQTEVETAMAAQDAEIHATQDMRNSLEAYIYSARDALLDAWAPFAAEAEADTLRGALQAAEAWLGDNYEAEKATYEGKLNALRAQGNVFLSRKAESEGRADAGAALLRTIEDFRAVIQNRDGKHAHLSDADRDIMRAACTEAENWFRDKQTEQASLPESRDPVLRVSDINTRRENIVKELGRIANKPVPPPPAPAPEKTSAPAPAPAPAAEQPPQEDAGTQPQPQPQEPADTSQGEAKMEA